MRYRLDLLVLYSLFASHRFGSTATPKRQELLAISGESLVVLSRTGPTLRADRGGRRVGRSDARIAP
jgi:hypothetical protein